MAFFGIGEGASAIFSPDRKHRYRLVRIWDTDKPRLPWVMYNPSVAGEIENDPTIRRVTGFSARDGYGGLVVGNLHAFVTSDPKELMRADDPFGPESRDHLLFIIREAARDQVPIICAWGRNPPLLQIDRWFKEKAREGGVKLKCLGTNYDASPKHPLYVPGSAEFKDFA